MKIKELAKAPQLQHCVIDSDFILEAYGEPLEFWIHDRLDIPVWLKLASLKNDQSQLFSFLADVIRDEKGNLVLKQGEMLPIEIIRVVVEAIVSKLGNFKAQTSEISQ